jgi:hypothetical protein
MPQIHVRVHVGLALSSNGSYSGGTSVHTGQLYFDDAVADSIALLEPYDARARTSTRKLLFADSIYTRSGGGIVAVSHAPPTAAGAAAAAAAYAGGVYGTVTLGIEAAEDGQPLTSEARRRSSAAVVGAVLVVVAAAAAAVAR